MSPLQTLASLPTMFGPETTVTICLAKMSDANEIELRSINIGDGAATAFRDMAAAFTQRFSALLENGDLRVLSFTGGYKPDPHEIEWLSATDSDVGRMIAALPGATDIPLIDPADHFVDQVRFYVLALSNGQHECKLFRKYGRTKELSRSRNIFLRFAGDRYDRLEEPMFQFDEKFDAISWGDFIFSFNKASFQHIFRYYELLRGIAVASLAEISVRIPIANFASFEASCMNHLQKLAKLRNIAAKPYLQRVTMDDLKRTIAKFGLKISVSVENGEEKLQFDETDKWAILNLLDDAYLGSEMTGLLYEANSKRELD